MENCCVYYGKLLALLWFLAILGRALSFRSDTKEIKLPKYMVHPIIMDRRHYFIILPFDDKSIIDKLVDDITDAFGIQHSKNLMKYTTSKGVANHTQKIDISAQIKNEIHSHIEEGKKHNTTVAILPTYGQLLKHYEQPSTIRTSTDLRWSKDVTELIKFVNSVGQNSMLLSEHQKLESIPHFELLDLVGTKDNMIDWIKTILGSSKDRQTKYTYNVIKARFNEKKIRFSGTYQKIAKFRW